MADNRTLEGERSVRSKMLALLSYMGVLCLVPLVVNKTNEFVTFHARQGLVLWIWGVLAIFGLYVPVVGPLFFSVSALLIMAFSLAGLVSVLLTKAWKLPMVGSWADSL
jgi:uncharacterized membrane protein